jgi:hypothetical protein
MRHAGKCLSVLCFASLSAQADDAKQVYPTAAAAEYAFARTAEKMGTRASFLQWFANDGVMCSPSVVPAIETITKWPASKDSLKWYPSRSYTASSNDLGYTMGPWTYSSADGKVVKAGTVLSVWRKQPNGDWRVVMDCGVPHAKPAALPKGLDEHAPPAAAVASDQPLTEWYETVARAEQQFAEAAARDGAAAALKQFATPDVHVLYSGVPPTETLAASSKLLADKQVNKTFQHVYTNQSRDGSLGYAWGYIGNSKAAKPSAVYVNVWRKEKAAEPWKIVALTYQPLPN